MEWTKTKDDGVKEKVDRNIYIQWNYYMQTYIFQTFTIVLELTVAWQAYLTD